jgi:type VI secretion system protein ImpK
MSQNEPFSFDDKTQIIRPSPDWRGQTDSFNDSVHKPPPSFAATPITIDLDRLVGENSLVTAALPLLSLVPSLSNTLEYTDISGLRQRLVGEVERFKKLLQGSEYGAKATYALCSLLDETIQKTPWGEDSAWAKQSLSVLFHSHVWGGEGFFDITDRLIRYPEQNFPLIELYYLCLSLGFEGKYGIMPNGRSELEKYRSELYSLIQNKQAGSGRDLSLRWEGLKYTGNPLIRATPWWVVLAVSVTILILTYGYFFFGIDSEPTRKQMSVLRDETIKLAGVMPIVKPPVTEQGERFNNLMQEKNIEVVSDNMLHVLDSFPSGGGQLNQEFLPVLQKIANDLSLRQNKILVTGHTDDRKIHNFIFPDNWALSEARAKHVADKLIEYGVSPDNVKWFGRGSDEPLEANDSPEHRKRNRRVDIMIVQ